MRERAIARPFLHMYPMIIFDAQASHVSLAFFDMYSARVAPIDVFILLTDIYIRDCFDGIFACFFFYVYALYLYEMWMYMYGYENMKCTCVNYLIW